MSPVSPRLHEAMRRLLKAKVAADNMATVLRTAEGKAVVTQVLLRKQREVESELGVAVEMALITYGGTLDEDEEAAKRFNAAGV